MTAVVMRPPEDFSIARGQTTIGGEWTGTAGSGASIVDCPSGFGWAIAKDTSVVNNHICTRVITASNNGMGFAAWLTLNVPSGDTTWRPIHRLFTNGSNSATWLTYQPSTNQFRIEFNSGAGGNVAQTGTVTAGPADPTIAFHIAVDATSAGAVKIWIDGALITNVTGASIGSSYNRESLYAFTSTGAGQVTMGNVVLWDPASHTWDGEVKVIERLYPVSNVSAVGTWTTTGSVGVASALDETPSNSTTSTSGTSARVTLSDMSGEPAEVYGVWIYSRQQSTGQGGCVLHEPSYDHATATTYTGTTATGYIREYVDGPNAGGDWDEASLNALEFSVVRASGTVQFHYGHILVLRTLDEASGGSYTISIEAGSFSVSGQSVGLKKDYRLGVEAGAFTLTGQSIALSRGYRLAVEAGAFPLVGQDVGLRKDFRLVIGAGAFTLAGQDVGLAKGYTLTVEAGAFALAGQGVGLLYDRRLMIGAGSFVVTGQDVAFAKGYRLAIGAGSFTLAGQDIALTREYHLGIGAGSFTLVGQDIALTKDYRLAIDAGSFVVTGFDVGLTYETITFIEIVSAHQLAHPLFVTTAERSAVLAGIQIANPIERVQ